MNGLFEENSLKRSISVAYAAAVEVGWAAAEEPPAYRSAYTRSSISAHTAGSLRLIGPLRRTGCFV